jgi:hypothetical protein
MKTHSLKTIQPYFGMIFSKQKTFELRKNDRDFHVGDILLLKEYEPLPDLIEGKGRFTGRFLKRKVTSLLTGFKGIENGYCIMSISDVL